MTGEKNLAELLVHLKPELVKGKFTYCTLKHLSISQLFSDNQFSFLAPLATFQEQEGLTLVLSLEQAEKLNAVYLEDIKLLGEFKCISLSVHSSLEAVGLTAAMSQALASNNISANVFAGYYHDHILVPVEDAEKAMKVLESLSDN